MLVSDERGAAAPLPGGRPPRELREGSTWPVRTAGTDGSAGGGRNQFHGAGLVPGLSKPISVSSRTSTQSFPSSMAPGGSKVCTPRLVLVPAAREFPFRVLYHHTFTRVPEMCPISSENGRPV